MKLQSDDAGVGLDIAKAEVGILAIFDLGNTALAATELGGHLGLGESGGHAGDDELVDQPGLSRKLSDRLGNPSVAVSAEQSLLVLVVEAQIAFCYGRLDSSEGHHDRLRALGF